MSKLPEPIKNSARYNHIITFSNYVIYTYDHDPITQPHFYVVDRKTRGKKFVCIILINKPKYYKTERKRLSDSDIRIMKITLNSTYFDKETMDQPGYVWEDIINTWNARNKQKVRKNKTIPDYIKLNERN